MNATPEKRTIYESVCLDFNTPLTEVAPGRKEKVTALPPPSPPHTEGKS